MKNLIVEKEEVLEEKPIKEKFRPRIRGEWIGENRSQFNYKKVNRWLFSKLGNLWTDVAHDFCTWKDIPFQFRNLTKLKDLVITDTFVQNDEIYYFDNYFSGDKNYRKISESYQDEFYVNPKTLRLEFQNKKKYVSPKKEIDCIKLDDCTEILKLDGIWYKCWTTKEALKRWKELFSTTQYYSITNSYYNRPKNLFDYTFLKVNKKQLNKTELKKYGLKNY